MTDRFATAESTGAIRREFPCRRLRVADRGLREGMLLQMMRADGVWGRPPGGGGAHAS